MSKYEATQGPYGAWWWFVANEAGVQLFPPPLTEAEAKIVAFALNAVADGGRLQVAHLGWPEPTIIPYVGPSLLSRDDEQAALERFRPMEGQ